jgi:hypothetical protein
MEDLPIHTLISEENKRGSLLLCGLNHGYSKKDEMLDDSGFVQSDNYKSFFSDKAVNDYPFRNNIVKWFSLWGYDLSGDSRDIGPLEKSIIQTNWLQTCSNNMNSLNMQQALIEGHDSFLKTCESLQPKLILFFSQDLLWSFLSSQLSTKVEAIFGKRIGEPICKQKDVMNNGKKRTRFKFYFQSFENLEVVAMPHATGSKGIAHDYIKSFAPEMSNVIDTWWEAHKRQLINPSTRDQNGCAGV